MRNDKFKHTDWINVKQNMPVSIFSLLFTVSHFCGYTNVDDEKNCIHSSAVFQVHSCFDCNPLQPPDIPYHNKSRNTTEWYRCERCFSLVFLAEQVP